MYLRAVNNQMFGYKQIINFLVRALVVSVTLSLMPIVSMVVTPDYVGFNLEAADDKKKKSRKRV